MNKIQVKQHKGNVVYLFNPHFIKQKGVPYVRGKISSPIKEIQIGLTKQYVVNLRTDTYSLIDQPISNLYVKEKTVVEKTLNLLNEDYTKFKKRVEHKTQEYKKMIEYYSSKKEI